jgi:hypothetical protein
VPSEADQQVARCIREMLDSNFFSRLVNGEVSLTATGVGMQNLGRHVKCIHVMNAVVAGTSNQTGSEIDMQGFDGVMFIADIGALTATQITKLEAIGSNTSGSEAAFTTDAVTPAMADADSNKLLVLDVFRPATRYLKPVVKRGTANAVINCVIAILYNVEHMPIVDDATVSQHSTFVSP